MMAAPWTCPRCRTEQLATAKDCATCAERRTNARLASNERWAREPDRTLATAPARAKGPGSLDYWMAKVDPDQKMTRHDRVRAAENAKRAFYIRLGKSSLRVRKARRDARKKND